MKKWVVAASIGAVIVGGGTFASAGEQQVRTKEAVNFADATRKDDIKPAVVPAALAVGTAVAGYVGRQAWRAAYGWVKGQLGEPSPQPDPVEMQVNSEVVFDH